LFIGRAIHRPPPDVTLQNTGTCEGVCVRWCWHACVRDREGERERDGKKPCTRQRIGRFLIMFLIGPCCSSALLFLSLVAVEAPVLNAIVGLPANHPPAYFKSVALGILEQAVVGECRKPGDLRFTGPEVSALHYVWVTKQSGCTVKLKDWYHCALESALVNLPGIPITIWIVQPPIAIIPPTERTSWRACDRDGHIAVQTSNGLHNVSIRPIVIANSTTLGIWYNEPEHAHFLWTFKPSVPEAELSDFFRILLLQQYGGLYTDFDYAFISPQVRFIEDGAGREFTDGPKRFGGHQVANSFLKFSKGSHGLSDIATDMLKRVSDRYNPHDFSYIGMGSVTRTYLDSRFRKGCSQMDWTAYGRKTVFKNSCEDFDSGIMIGMHWKLGNRNNQTCRGALQALRLSCPASLALWDATHGYARV